MNAMFLSWLSVRSKKLVCVQMCLREYICVYVCVCGGGGGGCPTTRFREPPHHVFFMEEAIFQDACDCCTNTNIQ